MSRSFSFAEGEFYHLFNRGVEKRIVFINEKDKSRFQKLLYLCNGTEVVHFSEVKDLVKGNMIYKIERGKPLVALGAYCLMSNHFHLLVLEHKPNGISQFMQKLATAYTMYFNIHNQRTGSLFEGRFRARQATHDNYLKYLFSYIHLNPAEHIQPTWKQDGIRNFDKVWKYLSDYRFSSLPDYLGEDRPERIILSMTEFPGYFQKKKSMRKEIIGWLDTKPEDVDDPRFQG